jgi:hypothetical protein
LGWLNGLLPDQKWFNGAWAFQFFPFLILPIFRPFVSGDPVAELVTGVVTLVIYTFLAACCLLWHYLLAEVVIILKASQKYAARRPSAGMAAKIIFVDVLH